MFENAKKGDLYKVSTGQKAFYWYAIPGTNNHFLTLQGAHPGLLVDSTGKNRMSESLYADEYRETRKSYVFDIDVIDRWVDE